MQLAARYGPIIGGSLYWLRPGTLRLPPWPDKVPLTKGDRRTSFDVALYAGFIAAAIWLLQSNPSGGLMSKTGIVVLLAVWAALGLRDKVPFLAARPEIYGFFLVVSLFPAHNILVGWQFVMFFIWWGAASSKLNRHFPYVIAVMVSNTPWNRSRRMKSKLYSDYPDDLRPGLPATLGAHLGTAVEFGLPLVLILTHKGTLGTLALIGMIIFHAHITSTFALGVPLEWNLFMIFSLLFNFGHYGDVPLSTLDNPLLIVVLALIGVVIPVIGNLFPDKVSFLPSMRYYAGNWATSIWLFRKDTDAETKLDDRVDKVASITVRQLAKLYGEEMANYFMDKALAFRSMHSHGRALQALTARAVDDIEDYYVREGEVIAGVVAGWNFGDGHFHHEQLLAAVQDQAGFESGDVRVIRRAGSTCATWSSAVPGSRRASSSPSRSSTRAEPPSRDQRHRRRLRAERAGLRRRAGARGAGRDGARGRGHDRRRHAQRGADGARRAARRLLGGAPDGRGLAVPAVARARAAWARVVLAGGRLRASAGRRDRRRAAALAG
jgi:hypothetical protein